MVQGKNFSGPKALEARTSAGPGAFVVPREMADHNLRPVKVFRDPRRVECSCGALLRRIAPRVGDYFVQCDAKLYDDPAKRNGRRCGRYAYLLAAPGKGVAYVGISADEFTAITSHEDDSAVALALIDHDILRSAHTALLMEKAA